MVPAKARTTAIAVRFLDTHVTVFSYTPCGGGGWGAKNWCDAWFRGGFSDSGSHVA